jgi:hypothetical protein
MYEIKFYGRSFADGRHTASNVWLQQCKHLTRQQARQNAENLYDTTWCDGGVLSMSALKRCYGNINGYANPTTQKVNYSALQPGTALIPLQRLPPPSNFSLTDIPYVSYVTF